MMVRLPKWFIQAALLGALLLLAGVSANAAKALFAVAVSHPINSEIFDADYVQGLATRGIAKLPGHKPSPKK
jgi:hypothetical protein